MKNVAVLASLVSSLTLLNACGKSDSKAEQSAVASSSSSSPTLGGLNFNLGEHLQKSGIASTKHITIDSMGLSVGSPLNFLAQNNFTIISKTQKISAQYYTDLTILRKKLPGHTIDLTATAKSNKIEAEVTFRILGQSLYSVKKSSVMSYSFARDIGVTVPYPILPALSVDLGGSVGGEIGFEVAPGVSADNQSLQLTVEPSANLFGKVKAGASLLFARAEASGTVNVLKASMPVIASVGATSGQLQVNSLAITTLSGKSDLTASLSLGNILPAPAAKLWKKVFGKGLEYTYPLFRYEGLPVLKTPARTYQF